MLISLMIMVLFISSVSANDNSTDDSTLLMENTTEIHYFDELSDKINQTEDTLVLDYDYEYKNITNHGIVISKPITIDGAGHTLDGKKSSRIFNITSDNVVLKNINFVNGNALGFYGTFYGGGAIFWNGNNGILENCTFIGNSATGLEVDPYAESEIVHTDEETGISWVEYNFRPSGASTNQGGAITWIGDNGTVSGCDFKNNYVDYPNSGGAILWKGNSGNIIDSQFISNSAYTGSAVYWRGTNGTISTSYFLNGGICDSGIHWYGKNGKIKNSILLKAGHECVISRYSSNVVDNLNFWGDTTVNPIEIEKTGNTNNWILIEVSSNREFVFEGEEFIVNYDLTNLITSSGDSYKYYGLINNMGSIIYVADKTGFVKAGFKSNKIAVDILDNNLTDDFIELAQRIIDTPEGETLVLDKDYSYIAGLSKGILISKPITIDGAGHTLDGKNLARIFNITSDNVTLKNINFKNGNAIGSYGVMYIGGGAIYWSGNNGCLQNCNFTDNYGNGIENDPYDKTETIYSEDGLMIQSINFRPMGARTNEGGAIVWNGTNGTVLNCIFRGNSVSYPNCGGAIYWRGDDGKIIDSQFYDNSAWLGSAVYWGGDNGLILYSKFLNSGLMDNGIFWSGENGVIRNSILLSKDDRYVVNCYSESLNADYNFWGDTVENPNNHEKIDNVTFWYVSNSNVSIENMMIDESFVLFEKKSEVIDEITSVNESSVDKNIIGLLKEPKIISNDFTNYYKSSNQFKVRIFDDAGNNAIGKYVKFTIDEHEYMIKTDKNGYASLKINQKPGKYNIIIQYGDIKVKNKITVKTTLITKNLSKKVKKSAKFKIKTLNSKGNAYPKQKVKVIFKGKIYHLKTNKKGIVTFIIPKNLKVGKYTIKTYFHGLVNQNKIIVKK